MPWKDLALPCPVGFGKPLEEDLQEMLGTGKSRG